MEPDFFCLDGQCIAAVPENDETQVYQGYISDSISDAAGEFTVNPTLTCDFDDLHTINSFTLIFDQLNNEYCSSVKITFKNGASTIDETIYAFTEVISETDLVVEDFDQIIIEFIVTSTPYRRVRLNEIVFGVLKEWTVDTGLISATQKQSGDPIAAELPQRDFSFSIDNTDDEFNPDNPDGLYDAILSKQPIVYWWGYEVDGTIEWLDGGQLITSGEISTDNISATIEAMDVLNSITDIYYYGQYYPDSISYYDLLQDLIEWANVPLDREGVSRWDIHSSLALKYTKAPLPQVEGRQCFQLIANATGCILKLKRNGHIAIEPIGNTTEDFTLDFDIQKNKPTITSLPALKEVTVESYNLLVDDAESDVFDTDYELTEQTLLKITYDPIYSPSADITGGTIDSASYYTSYAELLATPTAGTTNIVISGYQININSNIITESYNDNGEVIPIENPLITSDSEALDIAKKVGNWYSNRVRFKSDYRGRPELDPLDLIHMDSQFATNFTARILESTLSYNGAWSGNLVLCKMVINKEPLYAGMLMGGQTSTLQGGWA
jgi:hypothetical protein